MKNNHERILPPMPDPWDEIIRKDREAKKEIAEQWAESNLKEIEALWTLLSDESVISQIDNENDRQLIDKIKKTWEVEVAGKNRALANSGNDKYMREISQILSQAKRILSPIVEKILIRKMKDYGLSEDDIESSRKLIALLGHGQRGLLLGERMTLADFELELHKIVEDMTKPDDIR